MKRFLFLLLASACAGASPQPNEAAFVENTEISRQSGGHVTVGLRVVLDENIEEGRTHLEAVITNMHGEESVTDLGEYDGAAVVVASERSEIGHLQLQEDSMVHDLVVEETPDHEALLLRLDGVVVREIALPIHEAVDAQVPFLLREPLSD